MRHSLSSEIPLIYEEYSAGSKSQNVSDNLKKESLSRQSSVSSPIDLSMRHNTKSPSQLPNEMSIRGKLPRRKTKKEHKNHKEKQPQKSMLKEKHASVVAALERSLFAEQPFQRKANDKVPVMDYKLIEPYIKVEAQDSEDVEMKNRTENGSIAETENAKSNLPSATLSDFILNLKPDQTKYLVEKVRQQLNVHKDQTITMSPNEPCSSVAGTDCDSKGDDIVTNQESDQDRKQAFETGDDKSDTQVTETVLKERNKYSGNIVSLKDSSVTEIDDIDMNEDKHKKGTVKGYKKDARDSPLITSRPESSTRSPEAHESDSDNVAMDHSHVESEKNNIQQTAGSLCEKLDAHSGSKINIGLMSEIVNNDNKADKSDKLVSKENVHEHVKNYLKECIVNRTENSQNSVSKSDSKSDSLEKMSKTVELVSQTSQESGSSCSLQGSQGSCGFEVISSPVVNGIKGGVSGASGKECREAEHSEDSMEVEFTSVNQGSDQKEEAIHETIVDVNKSNLERTNVVENINGTNNESETVAKEFELKRAKASSDTDEDDEESGLVIDEHVDNETEMDCDTVEMSEKNASEDKNIETDHEKGEASEVNNGDARDSGFRETCEERNLNNTTEDGKTLQLCNGGLENGKEINDSKKSINEEILSNSERPSEQNISNSKTVGNVESSSLNPSEGTKSDVIPNAQRNNEQDNSRKVVGAVELNQSISQEEMLKKGQSHTLFYHDGDGYKPIKIFIDNSEQSSLVLQRMFQSAQLANVNRQIGPVPVSETNKTSETHATISDSRNLTTAVTNVTTSQTIPVANNHVTGNNISGKVSESSLNKVVSSSPSRNVDSISVTSTKHSGLVTAQSLTELASQQSYQQVYIDSLKQKAGEEASIKNSSSSIKQSRKRTTFSPNKSDIPSPMKAVTQSAKLKMSNSSKTFDTQTFMDTFSPSKKVQGVLTKPLNTVAGKYTSEGTLTRVNPDIRSKLSKALLSQKKHGLVRSESDTNIVHSKGVLTNVVTSVPTTVQTSVTDSRQQL